jgi:uncharacterized protein YbjT (DUF2867 family)
MFQDFIIHINNGATLAELSDELKKVVAAVRQTGKAGSLTLAINVSLAAKGSDRVLMVKSEVKSKVPQPDRGVTVFYATDDNLLVRNDPQQLPLPLRVVPVDAPRELREVNLNG